MVLVWFSPTPEFHGVLAMHYIRAAWSPNNFRFKVNFKVNGFSEWNMRIGELAKISGLAPSRIRFYEASGLIKSVGRKANGYRDYAPDTEWVLEIITGAQAAGFSLEEIRQLLPMNANGWRHEELLSGLKRKVEEIEVLQQRLALNKAQLLLVIEGVESKPEGMGCVDNTQLLLHRLREEGVAVAPRGRDIASSK
ncbi:HTH-type transcriptional regulator CueR [compost metagenome]|jgi:DNA-binding transcriptional MerR regulator